VLCIPFHRELKQRNEGGWDFSWDEETKKGCILLEVFLPKVAVLLVYTRLA
jgi:hypothetical protein